MKHTICGNCLYWAASNPNQYERLTIKDSPSPGECRRRAPVALQVSDGTNARVFDGWPTAKANSWCGEWAPSMKAQMEAME